MSPSPSAEASEDVSTFVAVSSAVTVKVRGREGEGGHCQHQNTQRQQPRQHLNPAIYFENGEQIG